MTKPEKIKAIQKVLGVKVDGAWGPISQGAFDLLIHGPVGDGLANSCLASSFADPADIAAFKACKRKGNSDNYCFKYGDNGIGKWGDETTEGTGASVALPPETMEETWGSVDDARSKNIRIQGNGKTITAKVRDTMPYRKNITNGAGIDLNPDALKGLGLVAPVLARVTWEAA
jgi:hypothetical protein